jgi:hypothetical protein
MTGRVFLHTADYWNFSGFTVTNGLKGIILEGASHNVLDHLRITGIGNEGVHFRSFSSYNRLSNSEISDTGKTDRFFGEGVYVGSARSNWCDFSNCRPDASNFNEIVSNRFLRLSAEAVDVKEGTSGGLVDNNSFNGMGSDAMAWVEVKGNGWMIRRNSGSVSRRDGFLTNVEEPGWGRDNTFRLNSGDVRGPGWGIRTDTDNTVLCDNTATAARGVSNVPCG